MWNEIHENKRWYPMWDRHQVARNVYGHIIFRLIRMLCFWKNKKIQDWLKQ